MKKAHSDMLTGTSPDLTPELRRELEQAAALPDALIDTSDAPEVTDWSGAERGKFFRPVKRQLTLRIDADVVAYFQQRAPKGGYQTAMNSALREAMMRELRSERPKAKQSA